jgi:hypothetical protein
MTTMGHPRGGTWNDRIFAADYDDRSAAAVVISSIHVGTGS